MISDTLETPHLTPPKARSQCVPKPNRYKCIRIWGHGEYVSHLNQALLGGSRVQGVRARGGTVTNLPCAGTAFVTVAQTGPVFRKDGLAKL